MKKTSLVLLSLAVAGAVSARDLHTAEEHLVTPLEVSLWTPLQLTSPARNVYGLRWNIFYGENFNVYGVDVGLSGYAFNNIGGLQASAFNWVDGNMAAIQLGGLANVVNANADGIQFGGLVNYTRGEFRGLQLGSLLNCDGEFCGVQLATFNYVNGASMGVQLGVANSAVSEFHGWSCGLVNYAERMHGLQLGVINAINESGRGVQIGLCNAAAQFAGVQIGLFNIIGNGALPIMVIANAQF